MDSRSSFTFNKYIFNSQVLIHYIKKKLLQKETDANGAQMADMEKELDAHSH